MVAPDGLPSMGSHRVGHNWSNLAAAAAYFRILVLRDKSLLFRVLIGHFIAYMQKFHNKHHVLYCYILHRTEQNLAFNKLMEKNCNQSDKIMGHDSSTDTSL